MNKRFSNKQVIQGKLISDNVKGNKLGEWVTVDLTPINLISHGLQPKRYWNCIMELKLVKIHQGDMVECLSGSLQRILVPYCLIPQK